MALPGDLTTFTLTFGAYTDAKGDPVLTNATGTLRPSTKLIHPATGRQILESPIRVTIDAFGVASVGPLPHTDSAALTPTGFTYQMVWDLASNAPSPGNKQFAVPASAGSTIDFDLLTPTTTSTGVEVVMPSVISVAGLTGAPTAQQLADALDAPLRAALVPVAMDSTPDPFAPSAWTPLTQQVIGHTPSDGRLYYVAQSTTYQSNDYGATFSTAKGVPGGETLLYSIVEFAGYLWGLAPSGKVYRATPTAALNDAFAWSAALLTMTAGAGGFSCGLAADANYLYVGEYGDPAGLRPKIYRISAADAAGAGTNWTTAWQPATDCRHVHDVGSDPYAAGSVWATVGDGNGYAILYSGDHGGTWEVVKTSAAYQAVQISFDAKYVYFAADTAHATALICDRETHTFRSLSADWHSNIAIPGGRVGRNLTDVVFTDSTTITCATANFTADDVGRTLSDAGWATVAPDTWITAVTNSTTAVMSQLPRYGATAPAVIRGDSFYRHAIYGAVDPATGVYYCAAADASGGGTVPGVFAVRSPGSPVVALDPYTAPGGGRVIIAGGFMHWHQNRRPLIALVGG